VPLNWTCWLCARNVVLWCLHKQQKIYVVLSASFGDEIFYCEAFGVGFEREDVDTDCRILFFEEGDQRLCSSRQRLCSSRMAL